MDSLYGFWERFKEAVQEPDATYKSHFHFELTEALAQSLLELVLMGKKRATASSLYAFQIENEPLPKKGDYYIVTDFHGNPRCVIRTTEVTVLPYDEMTYDLCKREGEDDSLESWQEGHRRFYQEEGRQLGYTFTEKMLIVFEDFEMVYRE